jgi:curli biogenesis system outer membrane secretion channel CsgG
MRITQIGACLIAAAVLTSCATSVPVQITKPAEINMAGARQLAVLDFDYPREAKTDDLLGLLLLSLAGASNEKTNTLESRIAAYATQNLTEALVSTEYFTIISSQDIASKMPGTDKGGLSAVAIGQKAGAQAIFVGDITSINRNKTVEYEKQQNKDPKTGVITTKTLEYIKVVDSMGMTYRVLNASTGKILATKTFSGKREQRVLAQDRNEIRDSEEQCRDIVSEWIPQITRQIAPYKVTEYRTLVADKAKDPDMKDADKMVKNGNYEGALEKYLSIWKYTKNPAAGVNAAIVYDILGRLDDALAFIDVVIKENGTKEAVEERNLLRRIQAENAKLAEQMK